LEELGMEDQIDWSKAVVDSISVRALLGDENWPQFHGSWQKWVKKASYQRWQSYRACRDPHRRKCSRFATSHSPGGCHNCHQMSSRLQPTLGQDAVTPVASDLRYERCITQVSSSESRTTWGARSWVDALTIHAARSTSCTRSA